MNLDAIEACKGMDTFIRELPKDYLDKAFGLFDRVKETVLSADEYVETFKNKLDHEAVKEYWGEGDEDVPAQLFSGRAVQCSPEVLELLHQRKQAPIVVNKIQGDYK